MKDKNITYGDLKFIARKIEFWLSCAACLALGVVVGALL